MLRLCALLVGTYVASFIATSALTAPDALREALERVAGHAADALAVVSPVGSPQAAQPTAPGALSKRDRLARPPVSSLRAAGNGVDHVFEIAIADAKPLLVMRAPDGTILFRSDAQAGETEIARGIVAPLVRHRDDAIALDGDAEGREERVPVEPVRMRAPASDDTAPFEKPAPAEPLAPGCESPLGPVAGKDAPVSERALCIAAL